MLDNGFSGTRKQSSGREVPGRPGHPQLSFDRHPRGKSLGKERPRASGKAEDRTARGEPVPSLGTQRTRPGEKPHDDSWPCPTGRPGKLHAGTTRLPVGWEE